MRRLGGWLLLVWLTSCAPPPPPAPPPPKPETQPIAVAIIEFGDDGGEGENGCAMAVLEAGYRSIGKKAIREALPSEDVIDYQKLGQKLGADLIIDGGLISGVKMKKMPPARIVATRSGDILAQTRVVGGRVDKNFKVGQKVCSDLLKQLP
jgi:hypothetical protein